MHNVLTTKVKLDDGANKLIKVAKNGESKLWLPIKTLLIWGEEDGSAIYMKTGQESKACYMDLGGQSNDSKPLLHQQQHIYSYFYHKHTHTQKTPLLVRRSSEKTVATWGGPY